MKLNTDAKLLEEVLEALDHLLALDELDNVDDDNLISAQFEGNGGLDAINLLTEHQNKSIKKLNKKIIDKYFDIE